MFSAFIIIFSSRTYCLLAYSFFFFWIWSIAKWNSYRPTFHSALSLSLPGSNSLTTRNKRCKDLQIKCNVFWGEKFMATKWNYGHYILAIKMCQHKGEQKVRACVSKPWKRIHLIKQVARRKEQTNKKKMEWSQENCRVFNIRRKYQLIRTTYTTSTCTCVYKIHRCEANRMVLFFTFFSI